MKMVKLEYGEGIWVQDWKLTHSKLSHEIANRKVVLQVCPYDVIMHPIVDMWPVYNMIELISIESTKEGAIMSLERKMETMEKDAKNEGANEVVCLYYGNSDKPDQIACQDRDNWIAFCDFFLFGLE